MVNFNLTALAVAAATFSIIDFQTHAAIEPVVPTTGGCPIVATGSTSSQGGMPNDLLALKNLSSGASPFIGSQSALAHEHRNFRTSKAKIPTVVDFQPKLCSRISSRNTDSFNLWTTGGTENGKGPRRRQGKVLV
ncbi:hypothetical protein C8F04DRAFT_1181426 [Mycena alexandri]|uniref:Uncharacterized protein n=1 Tax=Mycena alexandri TaxID=1745969 RepID=A0AAD6T0W1_9AGAR|nr:hypothetical protein C8F04DRAFT_1181426 [Mycena alexandri]